ncbi:MAG TPA: tRNA (guanosine(37)-N1)-methyltransferase TrmD [Chloroflexota bacterium]|nr:tRNA (guanosine(37)-N1)-methyltransferase TrmD [Chloroflexota bacterium]
MLRFDILTLFPDMFVAPMGQSMIGRARQAGLIELAVHQLRDWASDRHKTVDDYAYGGGKGMLLKPEPIFAAVEALRKPAQHVILMDPAGERFTQNVARQLAREESLLLICGHYEGVDERVREHLVDRELSIGEYVLTGGELPAMVIVDAVARLVPGVLAEGSADDESFSGEPPAASGLDPARGALLEYAQYTRPVEFRGWRVPEVLLSGDHARIAQWRQEQAQQRTHRRRPDWAPLPAASEL